MEMNETLNQKLAGTRAENHASSRAVDNILLELETLDLDARRVEEVHSAQRANLVAEIATLDHRRDVQMDDIRASRAILKQALAGFENKEQVLAKAADISNAVEAVSQAISVGIDDEPNSNTLATAVEKINSGETE